MLALVAVAKILLPIPAVSLAQTLFAHAWVIYETWLEMLTSIAAPAQLITAWQNVHTAVAGNPHVLMFWSPNIDSNTNLYQWWPGANYVDIVGVDVYPEQGSTFASVYGNFYTGFATYYNKHFAIGETGSKEYTVAAKEAWLKELVSGDYSKYPCYASVTWFEYNKNNDEFRIIEGQSSSTVTQTLSNFQ